jgi:hypothetical protein
VLDVGVYRARTNAHAAGNIGHRDALQQECQCFSDAPRERIHALPQGPLITVSQSLGAGDEGAAAHEQFTSV